MNKSNKKIKITNVMFGIVVVSSLFLSGIREASAKLILPEDDFVTPITVVSPGTGTTTAPSTSCNSRILYGAIDITTTVSATIYGWFEWSVSPVYQWNNPSFPQVVTHQTTKQKFLVNKNTTLRFNETITGLTGNTKYYYRVASQVNNQVPWYSGVSDFTTPACPVTNTAPVITVLGSNPMYLTVGDDFVDPGATAWDKEDGAITVSVTGTVNTSVPGTYVIYYNAVDSQGMKAEQKTRIVYVKAQEVRYHTIKATAGQGGNIVPSGSIIKQRGTSQTFSITADANYTIADVLVDNVSVGAVPTYTFQNITSDHSIHATFKPANKILSVILTTYGSTEINEGQSVTMYWSSANAKECTGSGFETRGFTSGFANTGPLYATTTYAVTCTAVDAYTTPQRETKYLTITVKPKTVINPSVNLEAVPSSIIAGQFSTLKWSSSNATSCSAQWTSKTSTAGEQIVYPQVTTDYSITCYNDTASATARAKVTVNQKPEEPKGYVNLIPLSLDFYPDGSQTPTTSITEGTNATVAFKVKNIGTAPAGFFTLIITARDPQGMEVMKCTWQIKDVRTPSYLSLNSLAPGEVFSRGYPSDYGSKCHGYANSNTQTVPFGIMNAKAGTYTFTFEVDDCKQPEYGGTCVPGKGRVIESNENDNVMPKSLSVTARTNNSVSNGSSWSSWSTPSYGQPTYSYTPTTWNNATYTRPTYTYKPTTSTWGTSSWSNTSYTAPAYTPPTTSYSTYTAPQTTYKPVSTWGSYSYSAPVTSTWGSYSYPTPTYQYAAPQTTYVAPTYNTGWGTSVKYGGW